MYNIITKKYTRAHRTKLHKGTCHDNFPDSINEDNYKCLLFVNVLLGIYNLNLYSLGCIT